MSMPPYGTIYVLPLEKLGCFPVGEECDHPYGCWGIVAADGSFYGFGVATAMQRDLWIRAAANAEARKARCASIRWYCSRCQTVQVPFGRYATPRCNAPDMLAPNPSHVIDRS